MKSVIMPSKPRRPRLSLMMAGLVLAASWPVTAIADLGDCRAIADDTKRLACYDALADVAMQDKSAASAAPAKNATQRAQAPAAKPPAPVITDALREAAFGAEQLPKSQRPAVIPGNPLEQLDATLVKVRRNALDKATLWLSNGQVWRQTDSYYFPVEDGDNLEQPVTLKTKLLSGYKISPADSRRSISVKRIR